MVKIKALWRKIWYSSAAKEIQKWIKAAWKWGEKYIIPVLIILLFVVVVLSVWRMCDMSEMVHYLDKLLGTDKVNKEAFKYQTLRTLGLIIFGIGALIGLAVANRRAEAQIGANEKQSQANETQRQANYQKIHTEAITHLGHDKDLVRIGGASALYELSKSDSSRQEGVAEILCAHVRETTQNSDYIQKHKKSPSNEIQSILSLLSKLNATYQKKKSERLLNLAGTHLNGANLEETNLQHANLQGAEIQRARLYRTQMQGASLDSAQMQGAELTRAQMQGASLDSAQMQEAELRGTQMQEVLLYDAQMQGAELTGAQMQGAYLKGAQMQGAELTRAQMQEVLLYDAQMQGAELTGAQMQGAYLKGAQMQGAELTRAQMQGAYLKGAQMQGAELTRAQMQGAYLKGAQMQGADLHGTDMAGASAVEGDPDFEWYEDQKTRIKNRRNKDTELETVIWSGEKNAGDMEKIEEELKKLVQEGKLKQSIANDIMQSISSHKGKSAKYKPIPKGVITGKLTGQMADKIIKDYEEAMKSVPKSNK